MRAQYLIEIQLPSGNWRKLTRVGGSSWIGTRAQALDFLLEHRPPVGSKWSAKVRLRKLLWHLDRHGTWTWIGEAQD